MLRTEHTGSVGAAEPHRARGQLGWGQAQGRLFRGVGDHRGDGFAVLDAGESPPHGLADCFGHQVPAPPRRALLPDHRLPYLLDQIQRHIISPQQQLPLPPVTLCAHTLASLPRSLPARVRHCSVSSANERTCFSGRVASVACARNRITVAADGCRL